MISKIKKKGFTLVEVLAVIVILAIIAVITIPVVNNVIENSKKERVKISSKNYLSTLQKDIHLSLINDDLVSKRFEIKDKGIYLYNGEEKKLDAKGILPTSGVVCVDSNGNVDTYSIVMDGYVINNTVGIKNIVKGDEPLKLTCDVTKESIEILVDSNSCSKVKTITINASTYEEVVTEYKIGDGEWIEYNESFSINENNTIYARLRDTRNEEVSETANITLTKLDNETVTDTKPKLELSSENPTNQINVTLMQEDKCGLDTNTIEYGISETENGPYTYQDTNIFSGLKNNTKYYFKTKANDIADNGIVESQPSSLSTGQFAICKIDVSDVGIWKTSKVATISGETVKGTKLQYKIKVGEDVKTDWTTISSGTKLSLNWNANTTTPTYIYCRYVDINSEGKILNTLSGETYTETHIDIVKPVVQIVSNSSNGNWTNKEIILSAKIKTIGASGLKKSDAAFQYSYDGTTWLNGWSTNAIDRTSKTVTDTWKPGNTNIKNKETTMYIRGCAESGQCSDSVTTKFRVDTSAPTISNLSNSSNSAWTKGPVVTKFSTSDTGGSGIKKYVYSYDKSSTATNWDSGSTASSVKGTWNGERNQEVFVKVYDNAGNESNWLSAGFIRIDKTAPKISNLSNSSNSAWTKGPVVIKFSTSDTGGSGIKKYVYSYDKSSTATDWDSGSTASSVKGTWSGERNQEVFVKAYDNAGNESNWLSAGFIRIDKTAPTTPSLAIYYNPSWANYGGEWTNSSLFTSSTSTESGSGISKVYYKEGSGSWYLDNTASITNSGSNYTITGVWSSKRNTTIYIKVVDAVGNESSSSVGKTMKIGEYSAHSICGYKYATTASGGTGATSCTSYCNNHPELSDCGWIGGTHTYCGESSCAAGCWYRTSSYKRCWHT